MKILIVKLHALGDLVIATPAIRRLREGFPKARIDLLTTNWTAPAIVGNPHVDKLITVDNGLFFAPGLTTAVPTLKLIKRIRRERYDAAVLFHQHEMIDRFVAACGIRMRFRFSDNNDARSVNLDEKRHSADTAYELAEMAVAGLGGESTSEPEFNNLKYEWHVSDEEREIADNTIQFYDLKHKAFIVIFPGGGVNPNNQAELKRWGAGNFAQLMDRINGEWKIPVVLMGAPSDIPVSRLVFNNTIAGKFDFTGKYNLRTVAALVKRSVLAISNDSGPLHVSAAVGTPVVGIFGPTGASVKLPPGAANRAASSQLPCSPCYFGSFKGCIFNRFRCMEELSVEDVFKVVKEAYDEQDRSDLEPV